MSTHSSILKSGPERGKRISARVIKSELRAVFRANTALLEDTFIQMLACRINDSIETKLRKLRDSAKPVDCAALESDRYVIVTCAQLDAVVKLHARLFSEQATIIECHRGKMSYDEWIQARLNAKTRQGIIPKVIVKYDYHAPGDNYGIWIEVVGLLFPRK